VWSGWNCLVHLVSLTWCLKISELDGACSAVVDVERPVLHLAFAADSSSWKNLDDAHVAMSRSAPRPRFQQLPQMCG
jgi:hypothetical protein